MSDYLRNAVGFFIQFLPCAVMVFLPFPQEACRFRRKNIFFWMTVIAAGLASLFSAALFLPDWGGYPGHALLPGLMMLAAILLVLAAFAWIVREPLMKKTLVFSIVLCYAVAQFFIVNILLLYLPWSSDMEGFVYSQNGLALYAATMVVMMPLFLISVIRPLGEYLREIEPENMRREFIAVTVSTSIYLGLTIYCDTAYRIYNGTGRVSVFQRYLLPLLLFMTLNQGLTFWLVFRESIRRKRDHDRQRFWEIQRLQYEKIAGEMERTSRLRHDLRHHLNALGALNAQGKQDEITEYLKQYGAVYSQLDRFRFSGDPVVDSVLGYYVVLAGEAQIPVKCEASLDGASGVEPMDMTVLLGNCLENALEALRRLPESRRRLSIELMPTNAMLLLRIQNTCDLTHAGGEPAGWEDFASSKGPEHQGVGLRSVTAIAEKYDGSAQFQCKDGVFTTRVILNPTGRKEQTDTGVPGDRPGALSLPANMDG